MFAHYSGPHKITIDNILPQTLSTTISLLTILQFHAIIVENNTYIMRLLEPKRIQEFYLLFSV